MSTRHWVPGSNTNQGKDRHVRKHQGLQGTGWTLQTRGKAFGNSSPCTINDQGTGSPRSLSKIWNASRICVSSLRRGHANLLCIVPILVYVLPKRAQNFAFLQFTARVKRMKKVPWMTITAHMQPKLSDRPKYLINSVFCQTFQIPLILLSSFKAARN